MERVNGYHGQYLSIDVSNGTAESLQIAPETLKTYIGGSGLGTRLLLDHRSWEADPLSP